ncbi:MAG: hypothetical protein ACJA13_002517 [Paraglaciecola sp.]|jgi:hypothetical protein
MNYWQLRLGVYRHSLYQWLESVKQISVGLVALFPLAMPALIFIPLLALSVLADPASVNQLYFKTLWGYLLFTYSWVALQRDGIIASEYHFYHLSLPVSRFRRTLAQLGMTLYAANILVLGPFILFSIMSIEHIEDIWLQPISITSSQLLPIFGLVVLCGYYSISAVQQRLPWLSLLLMPFVGVAFSADLGKSHWLGIWFVAIFLERSLPLNGFVLGAFPPGIWRFYMQADLSAPKKNLIRYVAIILLLILADICIQSVRVNIKDYVAYFFSFLFGVLLATKLMDMQRLRKEYRFYLTTLPVSSNHQSFYAFIYCLLYLCPAIFLLALVGLFTGYQWFLLLVFYLSCQVGIFILSKYFLLIPVCSAIVLWVFST